LPGEAHKHANGRERTTDEKDHEYDQDDLEDGGRSLTHRWKGHADGKGEKGGMEGTGAAPRGTLGCATLVPQTPQNAAVSIIGLPQLPQNLAMTLPYQARISGQPRVRESRLSAKKSWIICFRKRQVEEKCSSIWPS